MRRSQVIKFACAAYGLSGIGLLGLGGMLMGDGRLAEGLVVALAGGGGSLLGAGVLAGYLLKEGG